MKVWYLYNSGFAVKTSDHFLIFDYYKYLPKNAGLSEGVIDLTALQNEDVIAFASHVHPDHYNRKILSLGNNLPRYRLVLSDDIPRAENALMVSPNRTYVERDFRLTTLKSNDEGVAFLLDIDGVRIYHAGDLNWWHWAGEPDEWNNEMKEIYHEQLSLLPHDPIDLAFVPVDPRLGEHSLLGILAFMKDRGVRHVVPMHFTYDPSILDRLMIDPETEAFRDRIIALKTRGESREIL